MNRRRILIVMLVLAASPLVGAGWQRLAIHRDQRRHHPPPGELVAIDDHGAGLHLHTQGGHRRKDNPENPVVLLDAGTPGFSVQWSWVQPAIAEFATVVSYDRLAEATHLSLLADSEHFGATVDAVRATLTAAQTAAKKQR